MGRVYILQQSNGKYYIGSTTDLERRIYEHTCGRVQTTKKNLPITLLYSREYGDIERARLVEKQLKNTFFCSVMLRNEASVYHKILGLERLLRPNVLAMTNSVLVSNCFFS